MFTGLVETTSTLKAVSPIDGGKKMTFSHEFSGISLGDSIAVSGACLTVVEFDESTFSVELSNETLSVTILGSLAPSDTVNLERSLAAGDRLGGHLVTGHVDGIGEVVRLTPDGEMTQVDFRVPAELARYVAKKGSITIDGVSLTVNEVRDAEFSVMLIRHTQHVTTLGLLRPGRRVNLEVDLIARYVERLAQYPANAATPD